MNVWSFTGNLGADSESRFTPGGDAVVSFSVGVKSGYGDKATTTWARCQMWGNRGQSVAPYLTKGQLVGVSGEVSLREYESQGSKRFSLDVRVNDLTLLGKRGEGVERGDAGQPRQSQQSAPRQQPAQRQPADSGGFGDFDDDIPF